MSRGALSRSAWRAPSVVAAAVIGVCLWMALDVETGDADSSSAPAAAATECCRPTSFETSPRPTHDAQQSVLVPVGGRDDPQRESTLLFERAALYTFCKARLADLAAGPRDMAPAYEIDPTGAFAVQAEQERSRVEAQCRPVGPREYAQVDDLLLASSRLGNVDASLQLLQRKIDVAQQAALSRALPSAPGGEDSGEPTAQEGATVHADYRPEDVELVKQVESIALGGSRAAREMMTQLLDGGVLIPRDAREAAAWKLASRPQSNRESDSKQGVQDPELDEQFTDEDLRYVFSRVQEIRDHSVDGASAP
jgi:hypothetical protein